MKDKMARELSIEEICGIARKINNWKDTGYYKGSLNGINLTIIPSPAVFSHKIKKVYILARYKDDIIGETRWSKDIEAIELAEYVRKSVRDEQRQAKIKNKEYGIEKIRKILKE